MSLAAKTRVACAMLSMLAAWPLCHRALVERYDLDPWRYFGFAMYCYPKTDVAVGFYEIRAGKRRNIPASALPPAVDRELRRFRMQRRARGSAHPDRIDARMREAFPQLGELLIVVVTKGYDRDTARFAERFDDYLYRAARSEPVVTRRGFGGRA